MEQDEGLLFLSASFQQFKVQIIRVRDTFQINVSLLSADAQPAPPDGKPTNFMLNYLHVMRS